MDRWPASRDIETTSEQNGNDTRVTLRRHGSDRGTTVSLL
jgi:hypothetical protein